MLAIDVKFDIHLPGMLNLTLAPHALDPTSPPDVARARPHAVVIGSGFGGLAAAVRLGARGYRVTVLERLEAPGGRATTFRQDGFVFDAGPTMITAPQLFEELWALAGCRLADDVDLRPLSPFYRIRFHDRSSLDVSADAAAMRAAVAALSPDDVAGYERFMQLSEAIYRVGFESLGDVPFSRLTDMLRVTPDLIRFGAWRSVHAVVAAHVRDPRLRVALSFHPLLIGGNPFTVSSIYCLIAHLERRFGVHYAVGGTGRLVAGLVKLIGRQGGRMRYGAEVRRILVRDGTAVGVELAGGEEIPAAIVVSNACAAWTYRHLVPASARRRWTDRRIEKARYSMGLFVWYFGTRRRFPDVAHHTILLGPRYRDLLVDIFDRQRLATDVSLYLHRPTASDATLAPAGCDAFYVLAPVPHLTRGIDWARAAEPFREAIARQLDATVLPGFEADIITSRVMTPSDFATRLLSYHGAGFGLAPILTQSAWFRPHNQSEDIKNLFLVGASTHPGAGVPGVLSSARVLDKIVPAVASFA